MRGGRLEPHFGLPSEYCSIKGVRLMRGGRPASKTREPQNRSASHAVTVSPVQTSECMGDAR